MREYVTIGEDIMLDFYKSWEERFQQNEGEALDKIHNL